ncbi:MAG: right-handed parallel beta-helix repeat-containing protein [Phycisphaerales bacterium]|nr:MAG: right-handed parallel beta-helix repeat-containing protein [Phycisphaerales bacterium]
MTKLIACLATVTVVAGAAGSACAEDIALDRDDMDITKDARIQAGAYRIRDGQDDGAVRITGDGITVDFQGAELVGCSPDQLPDSYAGKGIVIRGKDVTVRNAKVRGYKVGIHAHNCPGLVIEDVDVSGNFQQHLRSTPEAEDGADWLWPHRNDNNEWMTHYGAGLCVEDSDRVTIRRVRARNGQNGIIMDRVSESRVYDNDCSFLSGWGLAMWRSSRNVITRNAFDFCVRGYSHGVYNRGQDSAGILFFEQCTENVIAENSATHGGDGIFGFAGREALGEEPAPTEDFDYKRRGCNDNLLINNDFSYAPAHGIEMTFSFGNRFIANRLVGNAICGVWGGYSQETLIAGNRFEGNGEGAYGLERGGVNIEHGAGNRIIDNTFKDNKCGVHLWWDDDIDLLARPWAKANHKGSTDNTVAANTFDGDLVALQLRESKNTLFVGNRLVGVGKEIDATPGSEPKTTGDDPGPQKAPAYPVYGESRPVGARKHLYGRHNIIITEWGPYDFSKVMVFPRTAYGGDQTSLYVLGPPGTFEVKNVTGRVDVSPTKGDLPGRIKVKAPGLGFHPFAVQIEAGGKRTGAMGSLLWAEWDVAFFKWDAGTEDPREHADKWAAIIASAPLERRTLPAVDFKWGGGAPSDKVPGDHFGTVATTTVDLPAGEYKIWTVSDDGIRVWVDRNLVIDDWTHHPPKENSAVVPLKAGPHEFRVEHFEITGLSQLQVRIEPVP